MPLAVLLSAVGVPSFPPRPSWAPRVVAWLAARAAWLHRPPVAPPLGCGLPTRVAARAGFPGLRMEGRQPGRWCVPGRDLGPGRGLGDGEMTALRAVLPARPAGRGAAGTPVQLMPWPANPPGSTVLDVAGAWGFGPSMRLWAWGCTVSEGRVLVVSVGAAAHAYVGGSLGSAYAGPSVGLSGVPWRGPVSLLLGLLPAGDSVWTRRMVLRGRTSFGARGRVHVRVCGARGLLGPGADRPPIRGAGHGSAPGR